MRLGCGKVKQEVRWENQALLLTSLLYLGQLSQLVVDLGVVVYTAELLGTDTHGVHVDHGTGVGVGGVIHTGLVVDGVADSHAEGDVGTVQLGTYIPFSMAVCHTINHKSGMDHTTYAHTGAMVNVYAMGVGAEKFGGVYDNTEIYHKLAELTKVQ